MEKNRHTYSPLFAASIGYPRLRELARRARAYPAPDMRSAKKNAREKQNALPPPRPMRRKTT
jgi:hypothetical protein